MSQSLKDNKQRVREAYQQSGLTYDELAELTGLKRNSLACWITGRRNPNNVITNLIEEKVSTFLKGGGEYINKTMYHDEFMKEVYRVCSEEPLNEQPVAIMRAFNALPTVSIKILRGK